MSYFPLSQQMWGPAAKPLGAGRIAPCSPVGHFLPIQAQGELRGAGPCHTRRLERRRGIQVLVTHGYLRWYKIVGVFSWICSVVSDFHPFICFTPGSGDWNPSGVPTHQQQDNALLSRIFFVPKAFNRVRYNFSIFPYSLQEGTGLGLLRFSAVRCQLPKDGE